MNTAYATLLLIFIVVTYTVLVFVFVAIKNLSIYLSIIDTFQKLMLTLYNLFPIAQPLCGHVSQICDD